MITLNLRKQLRHRDLQSETVFEDIQSVYDDPLAPSLPTMRTVSANSSQRMYAINKGWSYYHSA